MGIRLLVVDDHRLVAEALVRLLQQDAAIQVVGLATTGPEALTLARSLRPSLVLMDVGLPGMDGIEATWTLRRQLPDIPVLILTMHEQEAYALEAMRAGAAGYLLKTAAPDELLEAVRAVARGEGIVYPKVSPAALQRVARAVARWRDPSALSRRELQVLQMISQGASIGEAAAQLQLSPHTVRNHLKGVYRKLGVRGRVEAAAYAVRRGLVKA
ncbi:MAG: response regulator transcription factor [Armatimonadota bacterium]|nr:response regulator transcription factor [Armatimonadota bacterium]MDR7402550.1 response regulator transcription factor [Armatimonadota bacterium]MDR7403851.1 response regulator transcription factor [Armatimonadota bacterium]MDR7436066.1 response regulator transcription factor [Armatimonadota bacterium]MDR7471945.1 response regulator transcription factor [Armatimonadota bacterium]